jgi:uncharacterized protein
VGLTVSARDNRRVHSAADDARDRDSAGRARSARPRDGLGRPLAPGSVGVERQPEGLVRQPEQALDEAQRLLEAGMPFHAHEVLEDAWKAANADERELWRGLAQLAVGMTHAARGNVSGATSLLRRGARSIEPYLGAAPHGIDVAGLARWASTAAAELDEGRAPADLETPTLR